MAAVHRTLVEYAALAEHARQREPELTEALLELVSHVRHAVELLRVGNIPAEVIDSFSSRLGLPLVH